MSEQQRSQGVLGTFAAGMVIGIVEVVLAISFAALIFGARIESHLSDGIGLYLVAAALALGILAWRGGSRGVSAACRTRRRPCSRSWRRPPRWTPSGARTGPS